MSGGSDSANIPFELQSRPENETLTFTNSNGFTANDLLLTSAGTIGEDCNITQVASTYTTAYTNGKLERTTADVPIGGNYALKNALDTLTAGNNVFNLGKNPQFYLFGVDQTAQSLDVYDLLQMRNVAISAPIGEHVFLLKMLYGIDSNDDSIVDRWVSPTEAGWTFSDLQAGTQEAFTNINRIKAIRIALVTRSSYPATSSFQESLDLFTAVSPDSLHQTLTLTNNERRFRYQVYETVVPLFNLRNV